MTASLALVGLGTVGRHVVEAIQAADAPIRVDLVADSTSVTVDPSGLDLEAVLERKAETGAVGPDGDAATALEAAEIDVLVEVSPTTLGDAEPGFSHLRHALAGGADVVTANKGPVALRYDELRSLADATDATIRMGATVGGAVPVVSTATRGLAGTSITRIRGVLNTTSNVVLTRMADDGVDMEAALAAAREAGLLEADPSFDLEGVDAALKCLILSHQVYDAGLTYADVEVTGITDVTPEALDRAPGTGAVRKLVADVTPAGAIVEVRSVPQGSALDVAGRRNAVAIETTTAGTITLTGPGGGGAATASAVMSDLFALVGT